MLSQMTCLLSARQLDNVLKEWRRSYNSYNDLPMKEVGFLPTQSPRVLGDRYHSDNTSKQPPKTDSSWKRSPYGLAGGMHLKQTSLSDLTCHSLKA